MPYAWRRKQHKKNRSKRDAEYLLNLAEIRRIVASMPNDTLMHKVARVCMENKLLIGYREGARYV